MAKVKLNNSLRLYDSNYYSDQVLEEKVVSFSNSLNKFVRDITQANEKGENEEHIKNIVNTFLKNNFFSDDIFSINTLGNIDSALKEGNDLRIIIETKKISNTKENLEETNINKKALWELFFYYLNCTRNNGSDSQKKDLEIRRLIVTDGLNWFVFDANDIERFCKGTLENKFDKYIHNQLNFSNDNQSFYSEIALYFDEIDITSKLDFVCFNLETDFQKKSDLKDLYKFFNRTYLLKEKYSGPIYSHALNSKFYQELLYIMGLKEEKESAKKGQSIIKIDNSIRNSFAAQLYHKFKDDKERSEEEAVDKTFDLIIVWLDRLLFIKLFEGQLLSFNGNDEKYKILSNDKIRNFDDLQNLFFNVLGKKDRESCEFYDKFADIPYLNSSLFERQKVEMDDININELNNDFVQIKNDSVLPNSPNNKYRLLEYVIDFLNCYNFGVDTDEDGIYTETGEIIDSSVLGLIFEKINSYQDGSFYTPSTITEYMSKNIIESTIVEKINKEMGYDAKTLDDLKFYISLNPTLENLKKINEIIDSIKICDPAVGSGHFLVSALNQIIYAKARLGVIFINGTNELLRGYDIYVQDDMIRVVDAQGNPYHYDKNNVASQQVQETLFNEKKKIIENSLFGVDINPKATHICRLRLWIELLKNAYYKNNVMETLPNIDINIKCGNSLISKIGFMPGSKLNIQMSKNLKDYRNAVIKYKAENDKKQKGEVSKQIDNLKNELYNEAVQLDLFGNDINESKNSILYSDAFEWAIEFPEIISDSCTFEGFDIIIGNPPYGLINKKQNNNIGISVPNEQYNYYKNNLSYIPAQGGNLNIYRIFLCLAKMLLKDSGRCSFLLPLAFTCDLSAKDIRKYLLDYSAIDYIEAFPERDNANKRVFENVKMSLCILSFKNVQPNNDSTFLFRINGDRFVDKSKQQFAISPQTIEDLDDDAAIPLVEKNDFALLNRICENSKRMWSYGKCYTGEVDLSLNKDYISTENTGQPLLKGAQVQKYFITNDISQGNLLYLEREKFLKDCGGERSQHYKSKRIVMQGITGVNEKYRLKMTIIDQNNFCANSVNYIVPEEDFLYFLLGMLNSNVMNWYFSKYSTNSNVNGYQVDKLPIRNATPTQRKHISDLVIKILSNPSDKTLQDKLNALIYKMYDLSNEEIKIIEGTLK